jgi:hypothetical protein
LTNSNVAFSPILLEPEGDAERKKYEESKPKAFPIYGDAAG